MNELPHITAEGTLVDDPELRFTPKGIPVAKWRIACNETGWNKTTQEWETVRTTFITGSCWRDLAENVCETLKKGDRVMVAGRLTMREWETRDKKRGIAYEIDAESVGAALTFTTARVERDTPTVPTYVASVTTAPTTHTVNTTAPTVNTTAPTVNTTMVDPFGATEPPEEAPF